MATLRTALASLLLLLVGGAALSVVTDGFQAFTTEAARRIAVLEHPVALPAVALQTQSGRSIDLASLQGQWLLIDFIYTRCPDYCLALGSEFAQLQDRLAQPIARGKVQLLSISFDPDHDTPSQLTAYQQRSGDRGQGWIASRPVAISELQRLKQAFGITVIPDGMGGYTHNVAIHLVNPGGELVQIFDLGELNPIAQAIYQGLALYE